MNSAKKYLPHYTYDDWLHWEGRWELIEGHPIAMSPMPIPEHQRITAAISYEMQDGLKKSRCKKCKAFDPIDYKLSDETILQPDLLIVCGKIFKTYLDFPPVLVVEVVSRSTEDRDRNIKYELYEQAGVKYYLIVDVKKKLIEIFDLVDGIFQQRQSEGNYAFQLESECSIAPALDNIWEEE